MPASRSVDWPSILKVQVTAQAADIQTKEEQQA